MVFDQETIIYGWGDWFWGLECSIKSWGLTEKPLFMVGEIDPKYPLRFVGLGSAPYVFHYMFVGLSSAPYVFQYMCLTASQGTITCGDASVY